MFIWADATNATFTATAANQFAARVNGGAWFAATDLAAAPGVFKILTLEGRCTGANVGANNDGVGIDFKFETETNATYRILGSVCYAWSVAAAATSRARLQLRADWHGTNVLVGVIEAPDTGSANGNARGIGAVDLHGYRANVTEIASGDYAALLAGRENTASGDYSVAVAGLAAVASGDHSATLAGSGGTASGTYSIVLGGYASTASGSGSVASGNNALANKYGQVAHGTLDTATGDPYQRSNYLASVSVGSHVDTTWYSLFTDGGAGQLLIPSDTLWTFRALVQGATAGMAQRWGYDVIGMVVNDGGTTSILAFTATPIYESDAAYDCQVVADDATDALVFQVRRNGGTDYDIWWTATMVDIEETRA